MNDPLFYVVYAYIKASEQFEIVGLFSKKEEADDCLKSYPIPEFAGFCVERLTMNEIKTILVKERLLALSEVLEPIINNWSVSNKTE